MYVVYINLLYFLSIFLFTYNINLLSQKKCITIMTMTMTITMTIAMTLFYLDIYKKKCM